MLGVNICKYSYQNWKAFLSFFFLHELCQLVHNTEGILIFMLVFDSPFTTKSEVQTFLQILFLILKSLH